MEIASMLAEIVVLQDILQDNKSKLKVEQKDSIGVLCNTATVNLVHLSIRNGNLFNIQYG